MADPSLHVICITVALEISRVQSSSDFSHECMDGPTARGQKRMELLQTVLEEMESLSAMID